MIENERQYAITRAQAEKFRRTLADLEAHPESSAHLPARLRDAEKNALRSQLETLQQEMVEYERLRSGEVRTLRAHSFDELPKALIEARIARGLTQRELAERLGLKEQQVQRYESTRYATANLARIREVIRALELEVREEVVLP